MSVTGVLLDPKRFAVHDGPGVRTTFSSAPHNSTVSSSKPITRSTGQTKCCKRGMVRIIPMVKLKRWFFRLSSFRTMSASSCGRQTAAP